MDLTERYGDVTAKMDELRAKLEEANEVIKESFKQGGVDFRADMEFTQNSIDEVLEEAKREHNIRVEERIDDIIATDEMFEARKEERREAARAKIKNLQDKINDLSQAYARADQEELIVDLLTYADECQEIAINMSEEAILAYKAAAEQIALYYEKYGEN